MDTTDFDGSSPGDSCRSTTKPSFPRMESIRYVRWMKFTPPGPPSTRIGFDCRNRALILTVCPRSSAGNLE
jgi:hypothetical protein